MCLVHGVVEVCWRGVRFTFRKKVYSSGMPCVVGCQTSRLRLGWRICRVAHWRLDPCTIIVRPFRMEFESAHYAGKPPPASHVNVFLCGSYLNGSPVLFVGIWLALQRLPVSSCLGRTSRFPSVLFEQHVPSSTCLVTSCNCNQCTHVRTHAHSCHAHISYAQPVALVS